MKNKLKNFLKTLAKIFSIVYTILKRLTNDKETNGDDANV